MRAGHVAQRRDFADLVEILEAAPVKGMTSAVSLIDAAFGRSQVLTGT